MARRSLYPVWIAPAQALQIRVDGVAGMQTGNAEGDVNYRSVVRNQMMRLEGEGLKVCCRNITPATTLRSTTAEQDGFQSAPARAPAGLFVGSRVITLYSGRNEDSANSCEIDRSCQFRTMKEASDERFSISRSLDVHKAVTETGALGRESAAWPLCLQDDRHRQFAATLMSSTAANQQPNQPSGGT